MATCATAQETAAGFNSDGGLPGHSVHTLQLDRRDCPAAPTPFSGNDRFSQVTVHENGDLLFREQHGIGPGKLITADQIMAKWPKGLPAQSEVSWTPASEVGLSRSDLGLSAANAPAAVRAGKHTAEQAELRKADKTAKRQRRIHAQNDQAAALEAMKLAWRRSLACQHQGRSKIFLTNAGLQNHLQSVHGGAAMLVPQGDPAQQRVSSTSLVAPLQPAASAAALAMDPEGPAVLAEGHACKPARECGRLDEDAKAYAVEHSNQHRPADGQAARDRSMSRPLTSSSNPKSPMTRASG